MKNFSQSKTFDPNESSLLRIQKEQSFFDNPSSGNKKKSIENEPEEEKSLQKEIFLLKQDNFQLKDRIQSQEKKIGDLELMIENLKICNMVQMRENKSLITLLKLNCDKTMKNKENFNLFLEHNSNSKNEDPSQNMNCIITKKFKQYFEDSQEIMQHIPEKNTNLLNSLEKNKNEKLIKIWDHQKNNVSLHFPHLTISNIKNSENKLLKKNGISTVEQQILNTTDEDIIIEYYEVDSKDGKFFMKIQKNLNFSFADLIIYMEKKEFVYFVLKPQEMMTQTYYMKKSSISKANPTYNFSLKLRYM